MRGHEIFFVSVGHCPMLQKWNHWHILHRSAAWSVVLIRSLPIRLNSWQRNRLLCSARWLRRMEQMVRYYYFKYWYWTLTCWILSRCQIFTVPGFVFCHLFPGEASAKQRVEKIRDVFMKEYGNFPQVLARSPGEWPRAAWCCVTGSLGMSSLWSTAKGSIHWRTNGMLNVC